MTRSAAEQALVFRCREEELIGILHPGAENASRAVVLIVGGPQYRVGSHRQFLLLARHLAANGIPVLRFDYRGMGDSGGGFRDFEDIGDDIRAAVDALTRRLPDVPEVILWGLCDAATAAAFYAPTDKRVSGLVLLNPWVRSEAGIAKAYIRHYYARRLLSADFWRKVIGGRFRAGKSLRSLAGMARRAAGSSGAAGAAVTDQPAAAPSLASRMAAGIDRTDCPFLLILSGNDLTAKEFLDTTRDDRRWKKIFASRRLSRRDLAEADHTFSRAAWRDRVADWTLEWIIAAEKD